MISSLYLSISKISPKSRINPLAMNFSSVASDNPSIFIASRLTNKVNPLIAFAGHSGLRQYRDSTSLTFSITVFPPHAGQISGISFTPLFVRFSPICGMIIFALYTLIRSPIPSASFRMILILCTLARLTVEPSSSTGVKIATGLIRPVLDGLHSISSSVVSAISSAHLNANAFRGNFAVLPRESP